ncbi:acyl-ACP--UDP-N-acetylglucosamine O-acyltransferase [Cytophagaceae bacterium DM2B3-1]|uniref:Acyl-ACP--UDP-N-acetylglucosamine O-acyltransferase n=1 Tax=Xanthocytophaga flava TaxID=3048013 RepID=A0AAE3QU14_9BACT|nr:acyl-ACP--UDP-N-acetylglucosamine O-acyltransferase [Xanthocytophaga flavus]MDJ1471222.1 acyl-ACP--UDP-N-acetylglucosamine O-acyltransferase [Xanthocytophaga flavus]MDJ1483455.1 acyl-ACP--UDP-N-acetylglucosamine O-acyltransferase [Xanthocytophaga flavus]MDJ1495779.1 acyl-ACP--UDP-N-acetylglucosamine O-acyltransferase [Xanthocytophaga flavus]
MNQPLAYIHPEAKIGPDVIIEPFATIHKNVEIGEGTWIGANAVINEGARIGKFCKIYPGAIISAIPQDLKFVGEETTAVVGDYTTIREFVTMSRGTVDKYTTVVGKNCLIMAYAHIGHDCIIGDNCILGNVVQLAGHVQIDDYVIFGGSCAVQQFSKIGAHTYIGGGSLVRKDVPPFVKAAREPLAYSGVNSIGLRRRGFSNEKINEIQEIYRYIYLRGLNNADALESIETNLPASVERDLIIEFIRSSERGIMRGTSE